MRGCAGNGGLVTPRMGDRRQPGGLAARPAPVRDSCPGRLCLHPPGYCLCLLICLGLAAGVQGQAGELLPDGGFETGVGPDGALRGWKVIEGQVRLTGGVVRSGALALEATDPGFGASVSVDSAHVACRPGDVHTATTWFRSEGPARPSLYLQYFDGAGERIGVLARFPEAGEGWKAVTLCGVAPRDAVSVSVLIFSGSGEVGTFQVDDVSLQVEAGSGKRFWREAGLLEVGEDACVSPWQSARPGEKWRACARARSDADATGRMVLEFVDGFLRVIGSVEGFSESPDWAEVAAEGVAPHGTTGVMLRLSAQGGHAWFEDLALRRVPREGPEVVDIGQQRQLFLDDYMVEEMSCLERVFHRPVKEPEPVIVADQPWEQSAFLGVLGNCVFFDPAVDEYRMYYVIYQMIGRSERQHYALATSRDGRHWDKPRLGIADFRGSTANNLLHDYESPRFSQEFFAYNNVIRDERDPDPARRYKALGFWMRYDGTAHGMLVAFSPDGLRWTEPPENPVLPNGDTHTLLGWDERIGKYVAYPRTASGTSARNIGYSTSEDFLHWTPAQTVMEPVAGDPPHYEIYGMPVVKYEGLYLGFPWAFIASGLEPLDTQLAFSRDGITWERDPHAPKFISRGPAGSFDDSYAITANPIRVGDELFFYYMACSFPHGYAFTKETKFEGAIGLARLRVDGFASLSCHAQSGGHVITRPLRFSGQRMVVNCRTSDGWLRAELQDAEGEPIPGFTEDECQPIRADTVGQEVRWASGQQVGGLAGTPVRVKLTIADGEVFSFGFVD